MFFHRRHRGKPLPGTLQRLRRGHRFEPGLRECLRDGSGWPDAACAPLWVRPRLCAINCVPTWSRPHRSRLSSPGDGAGSDIGPVMEPRGLMRIKSYVGKLPIARNFEEGAEILRWLFEAQFTKLTPQDWIAFAQRTWREHRGALMPNHDLKLARALRGLSLERLPTLWDQFDALAHIPLMVIRGANSDMLASTTVNAMLVRRGQLEVVVIPDQGHAPLLAEPMAIRRIAAFVASCDVPARD